MIQIHILTINIRVRAHSTMPHELSFRLTNLALMHQKIAQKAHGKICQVTTISHIIYNNKNGSLSCSQKKAIALCDVSSFKISSNVL